MSEENQTVENVAMIKTTPWTFDRTINLPFLLTVISLIVAGAIWGQRVDNRVQNLENITGQMSSQLNAMVPRIERMDVRGEGMQRDLNRLSDQQEYDQTHRSAQ